MVESIIHYEGDLHCRVVHGPSKCIIETDAPLDNNGRGEAFSPTDLVASALASCMATIMGIVAKRKGLALEGMEITVRKLMSADPPRRICKLDLHLRVPLPPDHPERTMLETSALTCPVHHSLHPDIEIVLLWEWYGA
jgi:uncharacterized OsmC-like protein